MEWKGILRRRFVLFDSQLSKDTLEHRPFQVRCTNSGRTSPWTAKKQ
jgi:hypothetical protein